MSGPATNRQRYSGVPHSTAADIHLYGDESAASTARPHPADISAASSSAVYPHLQHISTPTGQPKASSGQEILSLAANQIEGPLGPNHDHHVQSLHLVRAGILE